MEELGSSCFIVPENQSFETALRKLGDYTNKMAIIQHQKDYYKDLVDYTDA
jgi:ribosomal protein S21